MASRPDTPSHQKGPKVVITLHREGLYPPVYIASTLSNPQWLPEEMHYVQEDSNTFVFTKTYHHVKPGQYLFKYRLGPDAHSEWVLDEGVETSWDGEYLNNLIIVDPTTRPVSAGSIRSPAVATSALSTFQYPGDLDPFCGSEDEQERTVRHIPKRPVRTSSSFIRAKKQEEPLLSEPVQATALDSSNEESAAPAPVSVIIVKETFEAKKPYTEVEPEVGGESLDATNTPEIDDAIKWTTASLAAKETQSRSMAAVGGGGGLRLGLVLALLAIAGLVVAVVAGRI